MDNKRLIAAMKSGKQLQQVPVEELRRLSQQYPYFSSSHILLAQKLQQLDEDGFDDQLNLAALYAGDRAVMYDLFREPETAVTETASSTATASTTPPQPTPRPTPPPTKTVDPVEAKQKAAKTEQPGTPRPQTTGGYKTIYKPPTVSSTNTTSTSKAATEKAAAEKAAAEKAATEKAATEKAAAEKAAAEKAAAEKAATEKAAEKAAAEKAAAEKAAAEKAAAEKAAAEKAATEKAAAEKAATEKAAAEKAAAEKAAAEKAAAEKAATERAAAEKAAAEKAIAEKAAAARAVAEKIAAEKAAATKATSAPQPKPHEKHTFKEWLAIYRQKKGLPDAPASSAKAATPTENKGESSKTKEIRPIPTTIPVPAPETVAKPSSKEAEVNKEPVSSETTAPLKPSGLIQDVPTVPKTKATSEKSKQAEEKELPEGYDVENMAIRSIQENEENISETLAIILAAQGKAQKAIAMYEKLSLKFPEKSRYFADRIDQLKNKK